MLSNKIRIQQLLKMLPHPPEVGIPRGVTDSEIEEFALHTGISLPSQLRDWLKLTNGPYVGSRPMFGIQTGSQYRDIVAKYQFAPVWNGKRWLPIGGDGCGNYYIVPTLQEYGEGYPVVFVDTMQRSDEAAYIIASDVAHFVEFLLEDELKLADGWPFDRDYVTRKDPAIVTFHSVPLPWELNE